MLSGKVIWGLWKKCSIQIPICLLWILTNMKAAQKSSNFENKKIPAYSLLPLAENIAWQLWFVQFCFWFNSFLKIKSSISILDSTTKNSDWSSALRQSHLWTLKKIAQFNFQFVYYGSWQIWKPLNRVQTSKIKKFQRTPYCLWLRTLRDNYDLLNNFVSDSTLSWKLRAQFLF